MFFINTVMLLYGGHWVSTV